MLAQRLPTMGETNPQLPLVALFDQMMLDQKTLEEGVEDKFLAYVKSSEVIKKKTATATTKKIKEAEVSIQKARRDAAIKARASVKDEVLVPYKRKIEGLKRSLQAEIDCRIEAENRQREAESRFEDETSGWKAIKSSLQRTIEDLQKQVENERKKNVQVDGRLKSFRHNLEETERKLQVSEAEVRNYAELINVMNNNANVDKSLTQGSDGGIVNAGRGAAPCQPGSDPFNQTSDYSLSSIESVDTSNIRKKTRGKVRRSMSFDFANLGLQRTLIEPHMCLECVNDTVIGIAKGESDSPKLPWCPHQKKARGLLSVIKSSNRPSASSTPITERVKLQSPAPAHLSESPQKCFFSPMSSSTLLCKGINGSEGGKVRNAGRACGEDTLYQLPGEMPSSLQFKGHTTRRLPQLRRVGLPQQQSAHQLQQAQQPHEFSQSKQLAQLLQFQPPILASTAPVISKSKLELKLDQAEAN